MEICGVCISVLGRIGKNKGEGAPLPSCMNNCCTAHDESKAHSSPFAALMLP